MTHMDDQIAEHIKAMIRRIAQKAPDTQKCPGEPLPLQQVVRTLREPAYPYDLIHPTGSSWRGKDQKT